MLQLIPLDAPNAHMIQLVSENGTEVFAKYFRRLLLTYAAQIFSNSRNVDSAGSYPLLVAEVEKVTQDPARAAMIAEAVDSGDGEVFRDFDLSTFMEHFKMNPFTKVTLASAFRKCSRRDLCTKGKLF
jgi:CCR4-NOT transcription complex subunit 1